jgi:hypothetical protein
VACEGCTRLKVGDEVWTQARPAFAQYVVADESDTGLRPTTISAVDAGTIPLVGLTSLFSLKRTAVLPGHGPLPGPGSPWNKTNLTVVITSGSGGTGSIGIEMAKAWGAAHIATATTGAAGIAFVKSLGATFVTDYKVCEDKLSKRGLTTTLCPTVYNITNSRCHQLPPSPHALVYTVRTASHLHITTNALARTPHLCRNNRWSTSSTRFQTTASTLCMTITVPTGQQTKPCPRSDQVECTSSCRTASASSANRRNRPACRPTPSPESRRSTTIRGLTTSTYTPTTFLCV